MDGPAIIRILESVKSGDMSLQDAFAKLKYLPYEDLSFAKIDHHRNIRQGIPEVIFAEGKREEDVVAIARAVYRKNKKLLITKASEGIYENLRMKNAVFNPLSRTISVNAERKKKGKVLVLSAGTSDIPVAEEAAVTALFLGSSAETVYDVGVAGIHRLIDARKSLHSARVVVSSRGS